MKDLDRLYNEYKNAPELFQAGRYWKAYEDRIISQIRSADIEQLRSGKYPIFGTFGFSEQVYNYRINMPFYKKLTRQIIRKLFITNRAILPYSLKLSDIREMAYNHCLLQGQIANTISISDIETCTFGNPEDLFEINGKKYTMQFLNYYIRFCFAQKNMKLSGNETIVELGSGSGLQVEILKKMYPNLTILCFDLPAPLFLCEHYLTKALGDDVVVKSSQTKDITDLNDIEKGKVYMFGNWNFPLLQSFKFDVFWNAASFGEMEPKIVKNYLSYIKENCQFAYLLQARKGKESSGTSGVATPIKYSDYVSMLDGFEVIEEADALDAHRKMSQSGGYFQAVWQKLK